MLDELKEIINNYLPQQVGETLQARLALVDRLENALGTATQALKTKDLEIVDRQARVAYLEKELANAGALDKREAAVSEKEKNQKIFELEANLEATDKSLEKIGGFVDSLMRNTTFRKSTLKNHVQNYRPDGGNDSVEISRETTETAE